MNEKAFQYESTGERVRDEQRIHMLLRRVIEERVLLTVTLPGSSGHFSSAILDIDPDHDYILLDELTPAAGHEQLLKKRQMHVQARLKGVNLQFEGRLSSLSREDGTFTYRIAYPAEVTYHQKRAHFRVRIGMADDALVRFQPDEEHPIEGELIDISEGGICALLEKPAIELRTGASFPCSIHLDDESIQCEIETRTLREEGDRQQHQRVGFRFKNLTPQQRHHIARIVARMQRKALRKPH